MFKAVTVDLTANKLTTYWKVHSCHSTFWYAWNWRSSRPWVLSLIIGSRRSVFFKPLAVEVVVPGGKSHFGLTEDKMEGTVLPVPFGCHKMARKCC